MKLKEYSFLENTIIFSLPEKWLVNQKENNLIKITFPTGPYPSLDCYMKCFDNPKVNNEEKIRQYLLDGKEDNKKEIHKVNDTYLLEHTFNSKEENLLLWKVVNILKPRSFREIRFSLAWPESQEANDIVKDISKVINSVIKNIKFSKNRTTFDELGVLSYKLNSLKLVKYRFWNSLDIFFPKRWNLKEGEKEKFVNVEINPQLSILFEHFEIKKDNKERNDDNIITNLLSEITKDVQVNGQKLTKSEGSNYLFSFYSIENQQNGSLKNNIWYMLSVKKAKIIIISFIFTYDNQNRLEGDIYSNKIESLIKSSELN